MKLIKSSIEGISYCINKDSISYYGSFRHPITKKSTRKKLLSKDKYIKKNDKDALNILDEIIEELKSIDNSKEIIEDEEIEIKNYMTLNELADLFFQDKRIIKEARLRSQYPHLNNENFFNHSIIKNKAKNWKKEEYSYNANVRKYDIGETPVNQMTKKVIDNYMRVDINKRPLAEKTKFNILNMVSAIINHSINEELIDIKNPFPIIQKNIQKRFLNPKRKRIKTLTPSEITLLLRTLKEKYEAKIEKEIKIKCDRKLESKNEKAIRIKKEIKERDDRKKREKETGIKTKKKKEVNFNSFLAVYLAVQTAARANTVLNIRLKDIDFANRTINLYNFKASKQYKMPLNEQAVDFIQKNILFSFDDPFYEDDYLIRGTNKLRRNSKEPLSRIPEPIYDVMDELFNEGIDKNNNIDRDNIVNFHTIRRSIATNLANKGTPIYNIMLLLNHATTKQTLDYLNTQSKEVNQDISKLMEEIFDDLDGQKAKVKEEEQERVREELRNTENFGSLYIKMEEDLEKRKELKKIKASENAEERIKRQKDLLKQIPF